MADQTDEGQRRFDLHAGEMGGSLLSALVDELRLLPKPWPALPAVEQTEVIDRLRNRLTENVRQFCQAMIGGGRISVDCTLEQMAIKKLCTVTLRVNNASGKHDLLDALGSNVTLVLANEQLYLTGLGDVKADDDQQALDLERAAGDAIEKAKKPKKGKDDGQQPSE